MKNYRFLIPIALIALMGLSWYMRISAAAEFETTYHHYLEEARKYAEDGITKYAIENYLLALELRDEPEIYMEVADYYKEQKRNKEYLSWCEQFYELHPTEARAYDCLLQAYAGEQNYKACYDVLYAADRRNIQSDTISAMEKDLAYMFFYDYNSYEDVGIYSNNYCPVQSKGKWGFVDRYGNRRISCKYLEVGAYTQSNMVSVVDSDHAAYFIDKTGEKVLAAKEAYAEFGLLSDEMIAAKKENGKYEYVDRAFQVLFGEFDYASTMNGGIAAVRQENRWTIIGSDGNAVSDKSYEDVKIDEKQVAYRNERLFVKENGKYIMTDAQGKQIGNLAYDDAHIFSSSAYAAVKIGNEWCFVNKEGSLISDKKYQDARSFNNGLAAVKMDGKWGFVDEEENIVIEPQFFAAKDFNEKGSCFVQVGDTWQLLKLYRLNREN